VLLLLAAGCSPQNGDGGGLRLVTDYFSSEVRELEEEINAKRRELTALPDSFPNQQTDRIGYHSRPTDANAPRNPAVPDTRSIRLDLGSRQRIDSVVLVPADYAFAPGVAGAGYGFPVRWRLEVSDDPGFEEELRVLADHTGENFPNPRRFPVVIPAEGVVTRYVRLTATALWTFEGRALLALGELMVLQGGRNLAAALPADSIRPSGNDSDESPPAWRRTNLVDGQSVIGAPQGIERSPSEGFQSLPEDDRDNTSWVMLDLGREAPLHEVRLLPARSAEFPGSRGFGFPLRYRVEIAPEADAAFAQPIKVFPPPDTDFDMRNPQENPVSIRVPGTPARYVKVTATRLRERFDDYLFALSELQVFSGEENIAAGASVSAQNSLENERWSTRFLTDGFTSRRNLLSWPEYLAGLTQRSEIDKTIRELFSRRRVVRERVLRTTVQWFAGIIGAAILAALLLMWRHRRTRRHDLVALRRRLAQDIHDEIGSGLGTISLLSQMGGGNAAYAEPAREEFTEIQRISRTVTESLRDIVWFIRPETRTVGDLAQRLRETTESMLTGTPHTFKADCPSLERELPLDHKRQVLMFFKEALHNILRHSGASHVEVNIAGDPKCLHLTIHDDGCGFDPAAPRAGAGLTGMKQRAKTVGGRLSIESIPGGGTTLRMEVPWRSSRKNAAS
jgi:signal transduction histidine kinase